MQTALDQFEKALKLAPRDAAAVLCVCYSNYMAMRAGTRPTPKYVTGHAEALMAVPTGARKRIVEGRLR